jgi:hypothetical protein
VTVLNGGNPRGSLDVRWSKPVGDRDLVTTKLGGKLDLSAKIKLDGAWLPKTARPRLLIERLDRCGGAVVQSRLSEPLKRDGNSWELRLKTSALGRGCWRLSVIVGDAKGGTFELLVNGRHGHKDWREAKGDDRDHDDHDHEDDD